MNRLIRGAILSVLVIGVTGCSSTWSTSKVVRGGEAGTANASQSRKLASEIIVTEGDITDRKYRVIADISVNVNKTTIFNEDPTREKVDEKLRDEAATLGADAVILVRYGTVGMGVLSWGSLDGNGRAVAFTN